MVGQTIFKLYFSSNKDIYVGRVVLNITLKEVLREENNL